MDGMAEATDQEVDVCHLPNLSALWSFIVTCLLFLPLALLQDGSLAWHTRSVE